MHISDSVGEVIISSSNSMVECEEAYMVIRMLAALAFLWLFASLPQSLHQNQLITQVHVAAVPPHTVFRPSSYSWHP